MAEGFIVGSVFDYSTKPGDSLVSIGARFGVASEVLAHQNALKLNAKLLPGQMLTIDHRHIAPMPQSAGLLINLPQRMLYFFRDADSAPHPDESQPETRHPPATQAFQLVAAYPVGLGRPSWPTPMGVFKVVNKSDNKTWVVPLSIQAEMRQKGQVVKTTVPPGPDNPLGKYWLGLSINSIGIHGTLAPSSIYHFQSHGCIRLHPDDIEVLFANVPLGTPGRIIYSPVLIAESAGHIFIEAHRDSYNRGSISIAALEQFAHQRQLKDRIDWSKAAEVLKLREGIARDVTLSSALH